MPSACARVCPAYCCAAHGKLAIALCSTMLLRQAAFSTQALLQVEMYADPGARGGILEPEGIVEIKFRRPDLVKAMHRLDPVLQQMTNPSPTVCIHCLMSRISWLACSLNKRLRQTIARPACCHHAQALQLPVCC